MTIFALVNAALFPLLHLGRPWFFYWLIPYPATMNVWPNFKSALPWDVAAVTTYFTVSLLFWYLGLVPDLAIGARPRADAGGVGSVYGVFALGWRGSGFQWQRYRVAYVLLAALATPLVISVHSVVSLDFSIAQLPGWHSTIFPPYFVVGAIYSGLAMVLVLLLPLRRAFRLVRHHHRAHLDAIAKLMLAMGLMLTYSYVDRDVHGVVQRGSVRALHVSRRAPVRPVRRRVLDHDDSQRRRRPQLFWSRRLRTNATVLFLASVGILAGMWMERFVIIVTSLNRDFLTSSWHIYAPTWVDWGILGGSFGLFGILFLLFAALRAVGGDQRGESAPDRALGRTLRTGRRAMRDAAWARGRLHGGVRLGATSSPRPCSRVSRSRATRGSRRTRPCR